MSLKEYRTLSIAVLACALLALCALRNVHGEDLANVKWGLVGIVGLVAGRSVGVAAAGGGGLKGIANALTTNEKPEATP